MNKSPDQRDTDSRDDPRDTERRDLERERVIETARHAPDDPGLAADWRLKRELHALGSAELPDAVRSRALRGARSGRPSPWFVAAAAALAVALALTVVLQAPAPPATAPTDRDFAQLSLALNTLEGAGQRAAAIAGRNVSRSLELPDLGLAELPYAGLVRSAVRPANSQPDPTKENMQ